MDSQAIVNTMEVLETKPLNELVTEAIVKVCYVSELPNPNQTVIDKEIGKEIAATLPGAPVVGLFDSNTNDFVEHSRKLSVKDGEIKWEELTRPYGFVSPLHNPWYQDFMEHGEKRTYLMCKAFLWTRQYKEASLINNKGQSMELDEKDMSGYYEGDVFIFTHATLDKLCVLGDKYAPCFEGSKFMTTYAKGYNALAKEVESIIGKRYYILNDKLVEKPITLDYALEMGWHLEEAVRAQLVSRGVDMKYRIQGIYSDDSEIFVVLQEIATQEYVRTSLKITNADGVELGTEMATVSMEWIPKAKEDETRVKPLVNGEIVVTDTPGSTSSTMENAPTIRQIDENSRAGLDAIPTPDTKPLENAEIPLIGDNTEEGSGEVTNTDEASTNYSAAVETSSLASSGENIGVVSLTDTIVNNKNPDDTADNSANSEEDSENNDLGEEDPAGESSSEESGGDNAGAAPVADFTALTEKISALEQQVSALNQQLTEKDTKIGELEANLNEYRKKDKETEDQAKIAMVASYKSMLSEEDIRPVIDKLSEMSLDDVEAKLSVTYARKQRASISQSFDVQVNINAMNEKEESVPEFMKQAAEYDRTHGLNINL